MKHVLIVIVLFLSANLCFAKGDKTVQKNKKAVDREENSFRKAMEQQPNTATPYLDHANNLAAIASESSRAGNFYKLALTYDSTNAGIYKDYGKYLSNISHQYNESKAMLEKGMVLAPDDGELKQYLVSVNKIIAAQDADNRLRDYGTTPVRALNPEGNYAATTKFDSLKKVVADAGSQFCYHKLLTRYLADDASLTPLDMYMLIVGFSHEQSYNPFNYNDIFEVKMLASHNLDSAIKRGEELVQTNPLNPSLNRELMYYYRKKNDSAQGDRYMNRIRQFFNGVLYSGDGTCKKPYISLWAKEEYNFISYLGYKPTDNHSMGSCAGQMAEIIDMTDPVTRKLSPVYFNVALIYMQTVGK